eukprot:SAG22_NODE_2900_length_2115_cov_20.629464_1_plen_66_part_10
MSGARLPRSAYSDFDEGKRQLSLSTDRILATDISAVSLRRQPTAAAAAAARRGRRQAPARQRTRSA